ncbi:uncharacterized protein LOC111880953 [Lactuca sativa]|uniref:uncharacterized protein LOC111880953 n=1 Tax=Lactuca sativa TaxID=4236 RepID=UPI000CD83ACE|nr:uncharacterized protein LOC111880953 [Lactuca sativa]
MASGETSALAIGRRVVLPANFIGGPRNMGRKYIDAMTLVQKFGKPDIFLTLTCNPNWPEIKQRMMGNEETQNRVDLIVRVFHAKLEEFKNENFKNEIFGKVVEHTHVVSRAIIEINDGTGTIAASISTPEIEKLIPLNPNEVKDVAENVRLSNYY